LFSGYFEGPPLVQLFATCFTELTCSSCEPLAPEVLPAELLGLEPLAAEPALVDPVIFTSWPTCSLSFEVSPVSR
jgi:hypothetical protein